MFTDPINEKLLLKLQNDTDIRSTLRQLINTGKARSMGEAYGLIADMNSQHSLMNYLVRREMYEEAQWLKDWCDIVRDLMEKRKLL